MRTSRISTDCTVMPQGVVFSSRIFCSSRPRVSRSVIIWASWWRPIDSRRAVCELRVMAWVKSSTSRMDFSAFQTSQKMMASTLTGTVSRVRVDSARDGGDADALIDVAAEGFDDGNDEEEAGAAQAAIPAEAEDGDLLPLVDDLDGE